MTLDQLVAEGYKFASWKNGQFLSADRKPIETADTQLAGAALYRDSHALIIGIDRFMSEARALTNFVGNGVAAVVVSHWERELDHDALRVRLLGAGANTIRLSPPLVVDEEQAVHLSREVGQALGGVSDCTEQAAHQVHHYARALVHWQAALASAGKL